MYIVLLLLPTLPKTRQNCPQPARSPHVKQLYDFVWGFRLVHIKPTIVNPVPNEVGNHHVNKKKFLKRENRKPLSAKICQKLSIHDLPMVESNKANIILSSEKINISFYTCCTNFIT
jgi:hypothetical protein